MVLGGLWHGANWTFVLWGAFHGGIMAVERSLGIRGSTKVSNAFIQRLPPMLLTFFFVILGWVMFRAANVGAAFDMYEGMFGFNGIGIQEAFAWQIKGIYLTALGLGLIVILIGPWMEYRQHMRLSEPELSRDPHPLVHTGMGVLFILAVTRLLAQSYSPFLYFQF